MMLRPPSGTRVHRTLPNLRSKLLLERGKKCDQNLFPTYGVKDARAMTDGGRERTAGPSAQQMNAC
jgi:hypothetical protein